MRARVFLFVLLLFGILLLTGLENCDADDDDSPSVTPTPYSGSPTPTPYTGPTPTPYTGPTPTPGLGSPTPIVTPTPLPEGACRSQEDCGDKLCIAPGESIGCGMCYEPENQCSSSEQCEEGYVCGLDDSECLCSGPTMVCMPACTETSCAEGEECSASGLCEVIFCTDPRVTCEPLTTCTEGAEGNGCVRWSCSEDEDCGAGNACVKGKCYESYGFCSYPPPRIPHP